MEFCYPTPAPDLTQDIDLTQDHSQFPEKLKALDEFPEWGSDGEDQTKVFPQGKEINSLLSFTSSCG